MHIFFCCFDQINVKMTYFSAYANKLHWVDRTFSDCIAVLIAYRVWKTRKNQGEFDRAVPGRKVGSREYEWCQSRYLQLKVR